MAVQGTEVAYRAMTRLFTARHLVGRGHKRNPREATEGGGSADEAEDGVNSPDLRTLSAASSGEEHGEEARASLRGGVTSGRSGHHLVEDAHVHGSGEGRGEVEQVGYLPCTDFLELDVASPQVRAL